MTDVLVLPRVVLNPEQHLEQITLEDRRNAGQVYTPQHLVNHVLEQVGYTPEQAIENVTLLEPACGGGIFLETAIVLLTRRFEVLGIPWREGKGRAQFLETIESRLYGVEIDSATCEVARATVRRLLEGLLSGPLPRRFFERNILEADFLMGGPVDALGTQVQGWDVIVGNPPYVPTTRLSSVAKDIYRQIYTSANGRIDLYSLFFERAVQLLKPGGKLAFITPNKYLVSQSARHLRSYLQEHTAIRSISAFRSHKVFPEAATVPCITVLERGAQQGEVQIRECAERPNRARQVVVTDRFILPTSRFERDLWNITPPRLLTLAQRIQGEHPRLEAFIHRLSAGFATGRDQIYTFARDTHDLEPELLKPTLGGRDLSPFTIRDPGLDVLVPYTYNLFGVPELIQLEDYPRAHRYLSQFRAELETRHCVKTWGKAWYDLHDPVPADLATLPKILVPDIASHNQFAFDPGRYVPLHSAYYILPKNIEPRYLTALLNSRPLEFLVRLFAPIVKDGFSRYQRRFLIELPVLNPALEVQNEILALVETQQWEELHSRFYALFGLTKGEREDIEAFLESRAVEDAPLEEGEL